MAIVWGRTIFAALFLAVLLLLRRSDWRIRGRLNLAWLLLSGLILALHWLFFFQSIRLSSVALGLLAYSCFPIFVLLLEPLLFQEVFRPRQLLPVLVTLAGVALLFSPRSSGPQPTAGIWLGLAAGLTFAILVLLNRRLSAGHSALLVACYQDGLAAALFSPAMVFARVHFSAHSLWLLLLLGIFCTALAHSLFIGGMRRVKARTASLIALSEPLYAIVLAFFLLGEIPGRRTLAGGGLVLAMAAWVTWKWE